MVYFEMPNSSLPTIPQYAFHAILDCAPKIEIIS